MADINQIIDQKVIDQLKAMDEQLKEAGEHMDKLVPLMDKINIKTTSAAKAKAEAAIKQKELTEAEKQELAIQKEIEKTEAKINALNSDSAKLLAKKRDELQKANQAQKDKLKTDGLAETSLVKMRQKLKELTAEYDRSGTRTKAAAKEINDLTNEIKKAEEATGRSQRSVGNYGRVWEGLKSLLPVISIAAVGTAIASMTKQVIASTDTLSTQWAVLMGGMKGATDEFFRTLATGDWSNFLENIKTAIAVGREYEKTLDSIEAKQRALTIIEADYRAEIVKTEEDLKNVGLTNDERKAAGEKRIKIEEDLATYRTKLATDTYNNELSLAMQSSKLREDELIQLARDYDSEKKIKAERLLELQSQLKTEEAKQARSGASSGVFYPGMQSTTGNVNRVNELKNQIAGFDPVVQNYAKALSQLGNSTDEELNKVAAAYSNLKAAEESGREGIKRVITMVNSLNAAEAKGGNKTGVTTVKNNRAEFDKASLDYQEKAAEEELKIWAEQINKKYELGLKQIELEKSVNDTIAKIREEARKTEEEKADEEADKILERIKKINEEEKKQKEETNKQIFDAGVNLANTLFSLRNSQLQREFEAAEGNVKKQNELKKKMAQAEKRQALFNIAINTASGIMKAIQQTGLPAAIPFVIMTAALGALQAGVVLSQKVPEFAKGTAYAPGGPAMVGEKGRELIKTPGGKIYLANNPALVNLERGSKVLTNRQTEAILKDGNIVSELRQTRKAIQQIPQPVFLNGSKISERRNNYWKNYINQKHLRN